MFCIFLRHLSSRLVLMLNFYNYMQTHSLFIKPSFLQLYVIGLKSLDPQRDERDKGNTSAKLLTAVFQLIKSYICRALYNVTC